MKKFALLAFVLIVATLSSTGLAQSSQSHEVNVNIPPVMMIRMTNGSAAAVTNPGGVTFTATAVEGDFSGTVSPVLSGNTWTDIQVLVNRAGAWQVTVETSNADFEWNKISNTLVIPDTASESFSTFTLPVDGSAQLFNTSGRTTGWLPLGISPAGYSLVLDGTEEDGNFSTTVTYSIANF